MKFIITVLLTALSLHAVAADVLILDGAEYTVQSVDLNGNTARVISPVFHECLFPQPSNITPLFMHFDNFMFNITELNIKIETAGGVTTRMITAKTPTGHYCIRPDSISSNGFESAN